MAEELIQLSKTCPSCKSEKSLALGTGSIKCTKEACTFEVYYACPICDGQLQEGGLKCLECEHTIQLKKLGHVIDNSMIINHDHLCSLCNGPTIHRPEMNLSSRCYNFPQCSGQGDLFGGGIREYTFLDFETTGLEVGRDSIIEIGALKIDKEGYDHAFQSFVTPVKEVDSRITEITGITNEMLVGAPNLTESITELIDFIGDSTIVAHNADFDIPWLLTSMKRLDLRKHNNSVICTLKWAKKCGEPSRSLGALTKKYKIGHQNAHRALADAAATKELFFIFDNIYDVEKPEGTLDEYESFVDKIIQKYARYAQV
jgi:DNA polymerase-3 subunit alpha (Gram-positive type)